MARGFGSTYGTGASADSIKTGFVPPSTKYSISVWYYKNGLGSGTGGAIVSNLTSAASGFFIATISGATAMRHIAGCSTGNSANSWSDAGEGVWQHLCLVYNGIAGNSLPTVYVNGVSVSVTNAGTVGNPAAGTLNLYIGSRDGTQSYWDGMIAEAGYWSNTLLSAADAAALAKGCSPLLVRPAALSWYFPLFGTQSNEPDWGPNRVGQIVTGTKKQNHAPVSFWMPPSPAAYASSIHFSGTLALTQGAHAAALNQEEKFYASMGAGQGAHSAALSAAEKFAASMAAAQANAALAVSIREKFSNVLALTAPANEALIYGYEMTPAHPGRVAVSDAMQGGLLSPADAALYGLAANDAALFDVQISESV